MDSGVPQSAERLSSTDTTRHLREAVAQLTKSIVPLPFLPALHHQSVALAAEDFVGRAEPGRRKVVVMLVPLLPPPLLLVDPRRPLVLRAAAAARRGQQ